MMRSDLLGKPPTDTGPELGAAAAGLAAGLPAGLAAGDAAGLGLAATTAVGVEDVVAGLVVGGGDATAGT
jgi:hypothetical protein